MSEPSIFEKIVSGEIPAKVVWESDTHLAFLDINPLANGHTLVIPKENLGDYLFELSESEYQNLMTAAKEVATLLKEKLQVDRVLVLVEGFEVPHVHIHLLPTHNGVGFNHFKENKDNLLPIDEVLTKLKA